MGRILKILVPNFPAPDSFTDNVVYTLKAMGHEVRTMGGLAFQDRGRIQRIFHDAWQGYRPQTLSGQETWVLEQARDWHPDIVLCLTLALRDEVLADLKANGVGLCVAWWGDTPANMRGMGLLTDGWDRIYIKDKLAVAKFRAVGLSAEYLHEAANPEWHLIPTTGVTLVDSVVVAGNYYGYRQIIVERLANKGVSLALYGNPPPAGPTVRCKNLSRAVILLKKKKAKYSTVV